MSGMNDMNDTIVASEEVSREVSESDEASAFDSDEIQDAVPMASIESADIASKLAEAEAKCQEYIEFAKRERAEFMNYKRNNQNESLRQYDNGRASVIESILPINDNLERAVAAAKDEATRQGVELVLRQLTELMDKWGVSIIDRAGEAFDPTLENAVMRGEPGEGEPGTVTQVFQKGYKLGSRILRHAMVKVASDS